jgi:hypothetical protein
MFPRAHSRWMVEIFLHRTQDNIRSASRSAARSRSVRLRLEGCPSIVGTSVARREPAGGGLVCAGPLLAAHHGGGARCSPELRGFRPQLKAQSPGPRASVRHGRVCVGKQATLRSSMAYDCGDLRRDRR